MSFLPGRELELAPEIADRFIDAEAWADCGHLQQHAAGLAEVNRMEVLPVEYRGDSQSQVNQLAAKTELLFPARDGERDMVYGAEAIAGGWSTRAVPQPDCLAGLIAVDPERHGVLVLLRHGEPENGGEQSYRRARLGNRQNHAFESTNRSIRGDAAAAPGRTTIIHCALQLDDQSRGILERDRTGATLSDGNSATHQAGSPPGQRLDWNRKGSRGDLSLAVATWGNAPAGIGKGCPESARSSPLVTIVEVVHVMVVEVHRLLHETKSQQVGVEVEVGLGLVHGGSDVMQAKDGMLHGTLATGRYTSVMS